MVFFLLSDKLAITLGLFVSLVLLFTILSTHELFCALVVVDDDLSDNFRTTQLVTLLPLLWPLNLLLINGILCMPRNVGILDLDKSLFNCCIFYKYKERFFYYILFSYS